MIYDKLFNLFSQDIEDGQKLFFIVSLFLPRPLHGRTILQKFVNKQYVSVKADSFVESSDFISSLVCQAKDSLLSYYVLKWECTFC